MQNKVARVALRTSLLYGFIAALWILVSDRALVTFLSDSAVVGRLATYKGWAFVCVTASLLYITLRRQLQRWEQEATGRRQAEEAACRSKEDWERTFDAVPDLIAILDTEFRIVRANRALAAKLGVMPEECIGLTCHDAVHGAATPIAICPYQQLIEDGCEHTAEVHEARLGGDFLVSVSPMRGPEGELLGSVHVLRDITDRKRAEEAMRESQRRFKDLFDNAPVGYHEVNLEGNVTQVNQSELKMLAYSREEMLGQPIWEFVEEEDKVRQFFLDKIAGIIPPGRAFERTYRRKDRTTVSVLSEDRILLNSDGKVTGLRTIIQDITERKRAEEALRSSEEKYRKLVESTSDAILLRHQGIIEYANSAAVELFCGSSDADLIGKPYLDVVHPEDRAGSIERIKRNEEGFKSPPREHRILTLDGKVIHVESTGVPFRAGGRLLTFGIFRDITERKRAEEEREKLHTQLLQAQKMESVGRLAGGVAHDFNNMLGAIIGYAEMAMMKVESETRLAHDLEEILKAGRRSADLTRQLLAFARKQTISPKVLDLNDTVTGMLKMLRRIIGEDIDLVWVAGHGLWKVKVDPSQIDQILANLAVNARDAISGTGTVILKTENIVFDDSYCADHPGSVAGEYVLLSVSDTGSGMTGEVLEHLFEPFFTTKEIGKGTGLGLATVYGIVKQNEGFIDVESEPEKGTTFKIYLPRVRGEAVEAPVKEAAQEPPGGTETILLVEDEEAMLDLGKAILERLGYSVITASTPHEAMGLVERYDGDIHLLITDVVMPEMNGRELAERISDVRPGLKCLYMSGYTADAIAHQAVLDQGVSFIQKPFSVNGFAEAVRGVIEKK